MKIELMYEPKIPMVFSVIFFGVLFFAESSLAATSINSCQTLSSAGDYFLTQDVSSRGTCFTISGSNITLDLNWHTVTYNNSSAGPGIVISGSGNVVQNGTIIQGAAQSAASQGIRVTGGTGHELHHLIIRVNGFKDNGIYASYSDVSVHHNYVESHTTTDALTGDGLEAVFLEYRSGGGASFNDNILIGGHTGVVIVGGSNATNVYNNLIQQERRPGCKAPYGIGLSWRTHNVKVYNNQIISDNGRGIITDGWSQGAAEGASGNYIHDNRIDVQYSLAADAGYYVENAVYGIRDRYSSGNNTFEKNVVMVTNKLEGQNWGFYIGSDSADSLMTNILASQNTVIARTGFDSVYTRGFVYDWATKIDVLNNKYFTDGTFSELLSWAAVTDLTVSGNTSLTLSSYTPVTPTGLKITKFLNSYLLQWDDNLAKGESQTYEYVVYRDGEKLPISPRGGLFYVDVEPGGSHTYQVSALNLAGTESAKSVSVSTASAVNGWQDGGTPPPSDTTPPAAPAGLKVQ